MKRSKVNYDSDFEVIAGNRRSQAAVMVLPPATSSVGLASMGLKGSKRRSRKRLATSTTPA